MRVVAALDSFKGALSSKEAGEAVRRGILARCPAADVTVFSVGDGGEGTADALTHALHAEQRFYTVADTHGEPVTACAGCIGPTAVLDMASAAGIRLARSHGLDLLRSSTFGVGQLIRHLLDDGYREILVGLGGSGTSDGGIGALEALGVRLYDTDGRLLQGCTTGDIERVNRVDFSQALHCLRDVRLFLLYDAAVPLTGPQGAVQLFARQKGASDALLPVLEQAMQHYAAVCDAAIGTSVSTLPGAGAAGGLGYGLALLGGRLTPGAPYVLDALHFREAAQQADLIITGEGHTDAQTAVGKLPMVVARYAGNTPVICLCGAADPVPALYEQGMDAVFALPDRPMSLEDSMAQTAALLEKMAYNLAGLPFSAK